MLYLHICKFFWLSMKRDYTKICTLRGGNLEVHLRIFAYHKNYFEHTVIIFVYKDVKNELIIILFLGRFTA